MSNMQEILEAAEKAKRGQVASMKAAETYTRKLLEEYANAGMDAAASGSFNPISAIGGGGFHPPEVVDVLEAVFIRYIKALRKGVPTTLDDLNGPMS